MCLLSNDAFFALLNGIQFVPFNFPEVFIFPYYFNSFQRNWSLSQLRHDKIKYRCGFFCSSARKCLQFLACASDLRSAYSQRPNVNCMPFKIACFLHAVYYLSVLSNSKYLSILAAKRETTLHKHLTVTLIADSVFFVYLSFTIWFLIIVRTQRLPFTSGSVFVCTQMIGKILKARPHGYTM